METREVSRRDFLKLGAAAAAVGVVAPRALAAEAKEDHPRLEYRTLGRTGLKVTAVSLGCMVAPEPVVRKAFELGINWFDTANAYKVNNEPSEEAVGRVLAGKRETVHICTKVRTGATAKMLEDLDVSLKRLQTDHVEVLLAHNVASRDAVFAAETLAALEKAKKDGKARFIGVSTHKNMPVVIEAVVEAKVYDAVLTTYNYTVDDALKAAVAKAKAANIGVIAMKSQAPIGAMMAAYEKAKKEKPDTPEPKLPIPLNGLKMHEAALKWVLDDPNIACVVPGMRSIEHLDMNFAMMGRKLTYFDRRRLEQYAAAARAAYCTGCGACVGTCARGVNIPDVRRSLMYLDSYGQPALAQETYRALAAGAHACVGCGVCTARCARGVALQPVLREAHSRLA